MKKNYEKLVKIAYLNPQYRNAFFMLLGTQIRVGSNVETIKENASQGIFDNYTLGVLSTYFSSKGMKFKNPNPEGGKDQIAMSTLVNYYNERNTNPEYGKFARDTISEIQKGFNMFYADYERKQKVKEPSEKDQTKEDDLETNVDDLEIVDEEDQSLTPAQRLNKRIKKDRETRKNKEVVENKILKTLDEVGFKDEAELETFYDKVEEQYFYKKDDGKLYLKNKIEDTPKTRELVKKVLRNKLNEKEIEEIFNETKETRRSWISQKTNNINYSLAKVYAKSTLENYENTAFLIAKGLNFVKDALDDKYGEVQEDGTKKINWKELPSEKLNNITKSYFELLDEKYNSELNAGVRLSMRKNSKFIMDTLKAGLKDSKVQEIASSLSNQVVQKVTETEIYGKASETAKKYLGDSVEEIKKVANTYINEPLNNYLVGHMKEISKHILSNQKFTSELKENLKENIIKSISPDINPTELENLLDKTLTEINEKELSHGMLDKISEDAQNILYSNDIAGVVSNTQELIGDAYNQALDGAKDVGALAVKTVTTKVLGVVSKFLEKKGGLSEEGKKLLETGFEEELGVDLPKFGVDVESELHKSIDSFKENIPRIPTSVEVELKEKISTTITSHVEQSSAVDNFQDSVFNTIVETAVVTPVVGLLKSFVIDKAINKTYFDRLEKETDKKTRFEQEFLTFSLTPEAKEDEYRQKTKEILEGDLPLEEQINQISALVKDFDTNVRPAIAKALYGLGKRDASGAAIEGNLNQLGTYVFKRASDEFDFNKMFITASEDDQITNRLKELFASKKDSSEPPPYLNMRYSLDKLNMVKDMQDHVKNKLENPDEDRVLDVITGKRPFGEKTFEKLKKRKIQKMRKKNI